MADPTRTCIAWGERTPQQAECLDCPVTGAGPEIAVSGVDVPVGPWPRVCTCECRTCKRAWEAKGRPVVRDGTIETKE